MTRKRTATASSTVTEAQRMVDALIGWKVSYEEIAYRLRLSLNTIIRWRKARSIPHPGHLDALRTLYAEELRRHAPGGTTAKPKRNAA